MRLIREQRLFLKLFGQTNSAQRKALLRTITRGQTKALSEIVHNIIKFRITLTPSEKVVLRRSRHHLYILSDRTLGYQRKVEALRGKQKFIHTLLKNSVGSSEFGTKIMEKLVLVPYNKYQRLLDAQPVKRPSPTTPLTMQGQSDRPVTRPTTLPNKKNAPPPGERDKSENRSPPTQYTIKDWISF